MSNPKVNSKKTSVSSSSFEKKIVNNKINKNYVDLLEEDKPIGGQKFVCVSFCSPEKLLKDKQIYFFEQFLKEER